ncbi:hypothetical protein EDC04DRAFT_945614 [Pisolithus marmoratus]|nr:hypothetical protein EDC04DRAFT_945614 [Pisolithus marmoratus]
MHLFPILRVYVVYGLNLIPPLLWAMPHVSLTHASDSFSKAYRRDYRALDSLRTGKSCVHPAQCVHRVFYPQFRLRVFCLTVQDALLPHPVYSSRVGINAAFSRRFTWDADIRALRGGSSGFSQERIVAWARWSK